MSNIRYLVIYKDHLRARNKYFGPFVSEETAFEFNLGLPDPLEGGQKIIKALAPFDHNSADAASRQIIEQRAASFETA